VDDQYEIKARGACDRVNAASQLDDEWAVARFAGWTLGIPRILGFRSAPPQALRYRRASRAKERTDTSRNSCWKMSEKLDRDRPSGAALDVTIDILQHLRYIAQCQSSSRRFAKFLCYDTTAR